MLRGRTPVRQRANASQARRAPFVLMSRSPLLQVMPQFIGHGHSVRSMRRLIAVLAITAVSGAVIGATRAKLFGQSPIGTPFYWFHDMLFLPIKGYSYTYFFPESLVWYGLGTFLFLLWLSFYLLDRSLVRQPHIRLLRQAIAIPGVSPLLTASARWFKRHRMPPDLLERVVTHQRALALVDLAAGPAARGAAWLEHLTRLLIDLKVLPPASEREHVSAALDWQETMLLLQSCGNHVVSRRLAGRIVPIVVPILQSIDAADLERGLQQPADFSMAGCLVDLLCLATLSDPNLPGRIRLGNLPGAWLAEDEPAMLRRLAIRVEQRRQRLDLLRGRLERVLAGTALPHAPRRRGQDDGLLAVEAASELHPLLGALGLRIALHTSMAANAPEVALGFLEAVEGLTLAVDCLGPELPVAYARSAIQARSLLGSLPMPQDYQIAASLAERFDTSRANAWRREFEATDSPVSRDELELAESRTFALYQAAGPERSANLVRAANADEPDLV